MQTGVKLKNGVTKYTRSFELLLEIELHDPKTCSGCPLYRNSGRCSYLNKKLPEITIIEGDGRLVETLGRLPECPLQKVPERTLPPPITILDNDGNCTKCKSEIIYYALQKPDLTRINILLEGETDIVQNMIFCKQCGHIGDSWIMGNECLRMEDEQRSKKT